jgi:hypothetical protein
MCPAISNLRIFCVLLSPKLIVPLIYGWKTDRCLGLPCKLASLLRLIARASLFPDRVHHFFSLGTAGTILPKQLV